MKWRVLLVPVFAPLLVFAMMLMVLGEVREQHKKEEPKTP